MKVGVGAWEMKSKLLYFSSGSRSEIAVAEVHARQAIRETYYHCTNFA